MIIILAICIPVTVIVTGFLVLKSVQLGLRWQIQTTQLKPPEMNISNPIQPIVDAIQVKQQEKQVEHANSILDEYLNGPAESR